MAELDHVEDSGSVSFSTPRSAGGRSATACGAFIG